MGDPLVSCLCVTEGRPAFMPWLLWCFERQTWPRRELVIVDSSLQPFQPPACDAIRVLTAPPGTTVAAKRNLALQAARGELVTWFDDDDWQHPQKITWLVQAMQGGAPLAGSRHGWFVDLLAMRCSPYTAPGSQLVFNSAGFLRQAVLPVLFPENVQRASDSNWMQQLTARFSIRAVCPPSQTLFFWLCHQNNLSNPAGRRRGQQSLDALRHEVGAEAWGDTDDALDALRGRLQGKGRAPVTVLSANRDTRSLHATPRSKTQDEARHHEDAASSGGKPPCVGLMIKATVMDAPFLDVMVRHMVSQARYPFAERTIVVDRQPAFSGKYRTRPRASPEELDRILERLLADGIVDHVRDVDMSGSLVRQTMERYFAQDACRVPTHAETGGPIYPTLFGLESMSTDYVLQMDADVFFHTGPASWVKQSLDCMARDAQLWLMMAHPGPPGGPPGGSLGSCNARRAMWDEQLSIWRFRTATTRYFLCDRRELRGRLRSIPRNGGCAPLEHCISQALQRHGAFRGNLGDLKSWHLHAWYHGDPFPQWAASLARVIESGRFPSFQRGNYDLRLDRERDRREWVVLLEQTGKGEAVGAYVSRDTTTADRAGELRKDNGASTCAVGGYVSVAPSTAEVQGPLETSGHLADTDQRVSFAPLAVVIPVRNRAGKHLINALHSLVWQSAGRPAQVLVVSYGSEPQIDRELSRICKETAATLLTAGDPTEPWNKPLALNIGIRATAPDVPFVMTMDADMVLATNFLSIVLERLKREPPALILCRSSDLPQSVPVPSSRNDLAAAFDSLHAMSRLRPHTGTGGIQAARRSFFFQVRGYDEDLLWWGAMDGDMVQRAQLSGLTIEWIEDRTRMLHQWHPRKHQALKNREDMEQAKHAWRRNHELVQKRSATLQRNPRGWGGATG